MTPPVVIAQLILIFITGLSYGHSMQTTWTVVHNKAVKTLSNHLCGVYLMCHLNVERRQAQVAIQAPVTEFHQERSVNTEIKAGMPRRGGSVGPGFLTAPRHEGDNIAHSYGVTRVPYEHASAVTTL